MPGISVRELDSNVFTAWATSIDFKQESVYALEESKQPELLVLVFCVDCLEGVENDPSLLINAAQELAKTCELPSLRVLVRNDSLVPKVMRVAGQSDGIEFDCFPSTKPHEFGLEEGLDSDAKYIDICVPININGATNMLGSLSINITLSIIEPSSKLRSKVLERSISLKFL